MNKHLIKFPGVSKLEDMATALILKGFSFPEMENYIRSVCRWGNFAGVGGRVIKNNTRKQIQNAFVDAYAHLNTSSPNVSAALSSLNQLHGLGTPSFASKHLRFLNPDICPVYDSILTDKLPYSFSPTGYSEFSVDCQEIARLLNAAKIANPARTTQSWLAADVEAAMFACFYL
ncbi:hypothetical protein [Candidatus Methylobacter oryzae]|nr:hypothetical protein [Candidatus Methylobacter oryzae]